MSDIINSLRDTVLFESDEVESVIRAISCEMMDEDVRCLPIDAAGLPDMRVAVLDSVLWLVAAKTVVDQGDFAGILDDVDAGVRSGVASSGRAYSKFVASLLRGELISVTNEIEKSFINSCLPRELIVSRINTMISTANSHSSCDVN